MLLDNIKNCCINNKEVTALWLGGTQIWSPTTEPVGGNPFELYTPAEIREMIQGGTVEQYFKIGDRFTVSGSNVKSYTGLDSVEYMVVDFEYANQPTMVLMSLTDYGECSWYSTSTSNLKAYTSSKVRTNASKLLGALTENGLYDIAVPRSHDYPSNATGTGSTTGLYVIPSLTEIAGSGHGMSYVEYGTQLRYFREGGDFAFPHWCWTRERDSYYTGRVNTFYKLGGYSDESAISTSSTAYTTALIFLG